MTKPRGASFRVIPLAVARRSSSFTSSSTTSTSSSSSSSSRRVVKQAKDQDGDEEKAKATSTSAKGEQTKGGEEIEWVDDPLLGDPAALKDYFQPSEEEAVKLGPNEHYWVGDILVHESYGFCELAGWRYVKDKAGSPQLLLRLRFANEMVEFGKDKWQLLSLKARGYDLRRVGVGVSGGKKLKLAQYNVQGYMLWSRKKSKVATRARDMAMQVVLLHAKRENTTRTPCEPCFEEMQYTQRVEESFDWTPTADQLKAFSDVMEDMVWRKRPMDRLILGDVGFGKTEVAIRAIYRAVLNQRQAAVLAPTSILAAQHYQRIKQRFPEWKVLLLRKGSLGSTAEGKKLRLAIAEGHYDVVVGTHILLQKPIKFERLGLLVIDEEQRFGVGQKERLKVLSEGLDVLTLSATPIPRTLQMGLSGLRDMTVLASPPQGRLDILTRVEVASDEAIQEALERELARGGQTFYVVPRIADIPEEVERISRLVGRARVMVAHGEMANVEEAIVRFVMKEADVLVATTLVENGIDIPNANTIIIPKANSFGLSSLYQLRGRVGRSGIQAYALLMYPAASTLTPTARQRLEALKRFSSLGSGLELSKADLMIRGSGSVLGMEQSGDSEDLGVDCYMKILSAVLAEVRGLAITPVALTDIFLPGLDKGSIPPTYIQSGQDRRFEWEKARLASTFTELADIASSWRTRYGPFPRPVRSMLVFLHLHLSCRLLAVERVVYYEGPPMPMPMNMNNNNNNQQQQGGAGPAITSLSRGRAVLLHTGSQLKETNWKVLARQLDSELRSKVTFNEEQQQIRLHLPPDGSGKVVECLLSLVLPLARFVLEKRESFFMDGGVITVTEDQQPQLLKSSLSPPATKSSRLEKNQAQQRNQ